MNLLTLDVIVRRSLLERNLPIHWYSEFLFHQSAAIRELSKDTLQIINTVYLPVNKYGSVNLPSDFVDDLAVSNSVGGSLTTIPHVNNLNPLRLKDTNGNFVPYPASPNSNLDDTTILNFYFGIFGWNWYFGYNDFGEPTGGYFGANGGSTVGYQVFRERRQIQLMGMDGCQGIVLMYVSNGQSVDNATQIDWRAHRAIQCYSDWMRSPNASNIYSPEAKTYYNEKRLLRSNFNEMTCTDIRNIFRGQYSAAIKN